MKSLCAAADLAPADPRPYEFLGEMYGVSPDLAEEVTERLARYVQIEPKNARAHYYYAMNLWKGQRSSPATLGELDRVEKHLKEVVTLDPTLAHGFLQLGTLYADRHRDPEARVSEHW
ncbi:MAG: hypothetical protein GEU99_23265 [Luteitalea sp.]|nr:hypothetical protein [Luteitalea sp.]